MTTIAAFVEHVKKNLKPHEFSNLCKQAKDGEMGFGEVSTDWGSRDFKKG